MLMETIRKSMMNARQGDDHVAKSLMVTLYSEASMVGKNKRNGDTTDDECLSVVRKFLENAKETRAILAQRNMPTTVQDQEILILSEFMPQQMSQEQLATAIGEIISSNQLSGIKAMGQVMAALKTQHGGKYDGKMASDLVKQALA